MNTIGTMKNNRYHTIEGMARPNFGPRHPFFGGGATAVDNEISLRPSP